MIVAAPTLTVECLRVAPESTRATATLEALTRFAPSGIRAVMSTQYRGQSDLLLVWGPGHPTRFPAMWAQRERGAHVLACDLAYWQRDAKVRVSIDAAHPQDWVMRRHRPTARFVADGVSVENRWDADGPIIVAGLGDKARVQYGADQIDRWEADMIRACQARYPRPVLYRRKRVGGAVPEGVRATSDGPIERVLDGASLAITWHSNVAVDAIRLGIPVVCRDGAAAAICPSDLPAFGAPQPLDRSLRDRFLANLAWFQWDPVREAGAFWNWVREALA